MKSLKILLPLVFFFSCQTREADIPEINFSDLPETEQHKASNALQSMHLYDGLEATLFASEPELVNPTNLNVDEKGRVWVIEAINYRNRFNPENPYRNEGDRILILEDTDGDGVSDKRKVFYEGEDINSALGIWVMGNKVIVSASPNVILLTDEDGDDKADKNELLFTQLEGWDHDHGAHAFIFGPDGRLYFNAGNEAKKLHNKSGKLIKDKNGKDITTEGDDNFRQGLAMRCELDGSNVEVVGHNFRNNFELTVDSYGNIWQSDNDDDGNKATRINFVMEYGNYGFTDEMTGAGWRSRRIGMHEEIPKRHWHLNDPGVVPNLLQTGSGSPTGITFYEADLLPEVFHHQMIHCEPGHQVVRAYPVTKDGAGYSAKIVNVMKSDDPWFRPSDVCIAPDGSLLVADWYDPGVGGHRMGDTEGGRIYRIAPKGKKYEMPAFNLDTPEGAVMALSNPNLSLRYLAWMKLRDWGTEAEPALLSLWNGKEQHLRARALWLLARLPNKTSTYLKTAIVDANPDIKITGLRVARQLQNDQVLAYAELLANDKNPQVRRAVAIALRNVANAKAAAPIWTSLANQYDGKDRWYLEALGIAADPQADLYFSNWVAQAGDLLTQPSGKNLVWRMRSNKVFPYLIEMIKNPNTDDKDLKRYFRAFHFHESDQKNKFLAELLSVKHPLKKEIGTYALSHLDAKYLNQSPSVRQKVNALLPQIKGTPEWLLAVKTLGLSSETDDLIKIYSDSEDRSFAAEAANILFDIGGKEKVQSIINKATGEALNNWITRLAWVGRSESADLLFSLLKNKKYDFNTRRMIVESMGNNGWAHNILKEQLEGDQLEEGLIITAATKLSQAWNPKTRAVGAKYLAKAIGDVKLANLDALIKMKGDVAKGQTAFQSYCANCHQVNGTGTNFGPALSEIGSKLASKAMYTAILFPGAGINFGYEGFTIKMKDEKVYQGFIESKTENEISIRMMGGVSQGLNRDEIASIEPMEKSLMLEGMGESMGQEKLVDVVEYLKTLKTPEQLSAN